MRHCFTQAFNCSQYVTRKHKDRSKHFDMFVSFVLAELWQFYTDGPTLRHRNSVYKTSRHGKTLKVMINKDDYSTTVSALDVWYAGYFL